MNLSVFIVFFYNNFLCCVMIISDLYKMVCADNDTALNISIPVVMIPKSGGEALNKSLANGQKGESLKFPFYQTLLYLFMHVHQLFT